MGQFRKIKNKNARDWVWLLGITYMPNDGAIHMPLFLFYFLVPQLRGSEVWNPMRAPGQAGNSTCIMRGGGNCAQRERSPHNASREHLLPHTVEKSAHKWRKSTPQQEAGFLTNRQSHFLHVLKYNCKNHYKSDNWGWYINMRNMDH